jgi:hypothetical protein
MPRSNQTLVGVVEAKTFPDPIKVALRQAADYAQGLGRERCRRIILTDGLRYYVYVRQENGVFVARPGAYLNLARMVDNYPILEMAGAKEALSIMAYDWADYAPERRSDFPEAGEL